MKLRLRAGEAPEDRPVIVPVRDAVPAACAEAAAAAGFDATTGEALRLFLPRDLVLVGCGDGSGAALLRAGAAGLRALWRSDRAAPKHVVLNAAGFGAEDAARLAEGALIAAWAPSLPRAAPLPSPPQRLEVLCDDVDAARPAMDAAEAVAEGVRFARDLVVAPGNVLTPRAFADRLAALQDADLDVEVIGPKRLARLGAGGLTAVGGAAESGPYLVTLRWRGTIAADPVVFIGKGITFDTGGLSVKPANRMEDMRADMAGAAAAAGAMLALARRRSPAPAAAVLAIAENALGAASYRPGDVLRMLDGKTVEVVDTDAEGRLVLADALAHARTLRPAAMVTLATLTGSVVVALGHHRAGLFGTDPPLMAALAAAGEATGERLWPLPIGERHRRDLDSDIADLRHCLPAGGGDGWGGRFLPDACHAAAFLREFAGSVPWGHLDIAGVESLVRDGPLGAKGMPSGFGVRLLDRLVAQHFEDPHRL
jgi:leucyl aminopeptidase